MINIFFIDINPHNNFQIIIQKGINSIYQLVESTFACNVTASAIVNFFWTINRYLNSENLVLLEIFTP